MVNLSASYFTFQAHDVAKLRWTVPAVALYLEMCHCTMTGARLTTTGGDNFLFLTSGNPIRNPAWHISSRIVLVP